MKLAMLTVAAITLLTLVSVNDVSAQGRGRGRGRDYGYSGWGKKCDKFVNCHDARDGRWDDRGPRRRALMRNRYYSPYERTRVYGGTRWRRVYGDRVYVRNRRRW